MNYIQVGLSLKDDPRVYPSGLDGFGIVITLGLLAAEKYGANGLVVPPFSSAVHVARHANTDADRALAALTSLKAHGAITGSQEEGWTLAEDLWTMFAGRAIAERDRKRAQRAGAKTPESPMRKSPGQSGKSADRRVTSNGVTGTKAEVPGPGRETRPTIQPSNHPTNQHNNGGWLDKLSREPATHTEGHAEGEPPPCDRCGFSVGGLLYREAADGWVCACCPDCTTDQSLFKAYEPNLGLFPLPDADGDGWLRQTETPSAGMVTRDADRWLKTVRANSMKAARKAEA